MDKYFERIRQVCGDRVTHPLFVPMMVNACLLLGLLLAIRGMSAQVNQLTVDFPTSVADGLPLSASLQNAAGSDASLRLRSLEDARALRAKVLNNEGASGEPKKLATLASELDQWLVQEDLLGDFGEPKKLATLLSELDQWLVQEEILGDFQDYKLSVAEELRDSIELTVASLHSRAINSNDSSEAQKWHGEAGQLIALFPISEDPEVLSRATKLSNTHSVAAARLDAIRRQRYNLWALGRIGDLLNWLEKTASSWTTKDNPAIVSKVASALGQIDPLLLEPAASQLYGVALSKASEAISTKQQGDLASRLTDPSKHSRKTLGDF